MFLGFEYMKYRWNAKRRHGVHSPFIYELTDQCFRSEPNEQFKKTIEQLKKRCASEDRLIEITDHGVGSRKHGNQRKIAQLFKTSSSNGKYGRMLHQLVAHYKLKNCLELGTSLGVGSVCLATGNQDVRVTTIEGCPATFSEAQTNFSVLKMESITGIMGTFNEIIPQFTPQEFDLIFIDGHHDGAATLDYLNALLPFASNETFIILDDIRWSASMFQAWQELVNDSRFHVTIDLFRMGIVLLRNQQEKEHFTLRL